MVSEREVSPSKFEDVERRYHQVGERILDFFGARPTHTVVIGQDEEGNDILRTEHVPNLEVDDKLWENAKREELEKIVEFDDEAKKRGISLRVKVGLSVLAVSTGLAYELGARHGKDFKIYADKARWALDVLLKKEPHKD